MEPGKRWRRQRELLRNARELRQWKTPAEEVLWREIRAGRLDGLKFRQQHPIDEFIVDFCCVSKMLCIELDGDYHEEPEALAYDRRRQRKIESLGYRVLRIRNEKVLDEVGAVLDQIRECLQDFPPRPQAGEGSGERDAP